MRSIQFEAPSTVDEAVALLADAGDKARPLAGGTDLIVQMRARMISPEVIVDVKNIPELLDVSEEDGGFRVGAAVPGAVLGENEAVAGMWPGVVEALELIGSTQIQGRASLGGQPLQRLSRGGLDARDDRGRRHLRDRGTGRPARGGGGGHRHLARPDLARQRRVRGELLPPAAPGADRGRVPAVHSPHGDGHRGGRGGSVRHPRRRRYLHRGPGGSRRGGAHAAARFRGGRRPRRHEAR